MNYKIKDEKLQHDIDREAAKLSTLSSGKFDKYEYLTGDKILLSDQSIVIDPAMFTYFPSENVLEKQIKSNLRSSWKANKSNQT